MNCLRKLLPYYHLSMEEAQQHREMKKLIHELEKMSIEDFEHIKKPFVKPAYLEPGTIGSYLFGADLAHYGDVDKNCSLFYLQAKKSEHKEEKCHAQIFTLKQGKLERLENYPSTHGILYLLDDEPYQGLSSSVLRELSSKGVELITLVETVKGKHKVIYERESLITVPTELDVQEGFTTVSFRSIGGKKEMDEVKTFLPLIFIAGFVIFLLYLFL